MTGSAGGTASPRNRAADAVAERHRRFSNLPPKQEMTMEFHLAALRQVGFREVGCIWRYLSDYLALALL